MKYWPAVLESLLCAVALAVVAAAVSTVTNPRPLPLHATTAPFSALAQAPNPNHEGHKMRPDGQNCKASGPDACTCTATSCVRDDQGHVTSWHPSSQCQWYCETDHCTCHPCLEGDCPDGVDHR